jgi:hypothetical protein
MITKGFKCDVCGVERKEANHWFVFWFDKIKNTVEIAAWGENANYQGFQHVCGQEHLNVLVSRWIEDNRPVKENNPPKEEWHPAPPMP